MTTAYRRVIIISCTSSLVNCELIFQLDFHLIKFASERLGFTIFAISFNVGMRYATSKTSVEDPDHFDAAPTSEKNWIRIRLCSI
jgi:hypothetical protein